MPATNPVTDPLLAFLGKRYAAPHPMPLRGTRYDVRIAAGLAVVETVRTFTNAETESIEATLTFPVPVHAVLHELTARIDGRPYRAMARRKADARQTYEGAIDAGKAAVLHEEVLRGMHMLSVAHVGPDSTIEVTARFATTLAAIDGRGVLRIPLTVGDIYGRSGLPDSDELIHGPIADAYGELTVRCDDGPVFLGGEIVKSGALRIPLDAPIELRVDAWPRREIRGRAADGRAVSLRIEPAPAVSGPLDVAILVDRSGSMAELAGGRSSGTKHAAIRSGLRDLASKLTGGDRVDLWEFETGVAPVGSHVSGEPGGRGNGLLRLVDRLSEPNGGTEIGRALTTVLQSSPARDILLVTDGKSHALDVQALSRAGRRISVVLIGEDSLEANVGHLAALTGGEILVPSGQGIAGALAAAVSGLRSSVELRTPLVGRPEHVTRRRSGAIVTARWDDQHPAGGDDGLNRAVAAVAASMALPDLVEEEAAALAEAEGLVTHLTSLVLVDEAGEAQVGLPHTRKVALPSPGSHRFAAASDFPAVVLREGGDVLRSRSLLKLTSAPPVRPSVAAHSRLPPLLLLAKEIDWRKGVRRLAKADLSELPADVAGRMERLAGSEELRAMAQQLGVSERMIAIALLAHLASAMDRHAARVARSMARRGLTEDVLERLHLTLV